MPVPQKCPYNERNRMSWPISCGFGVLSWLVVEHISIQAIFLFMAPQYIYINYFYYEFSGQEVIDLTLLAVLIHASTFRNAHQSWYKKNVCYRAWSLAARTMRSLSVFNTNNLLGCNANKQHCGAAYFFNYVLHSGICIGHIAGGTYVC